MKLVCWAGLGYWNKGILRTKEGTKGGGEGARGGTKGRDQGRERGELKSTPHETSCHGGGAGFPSDPTNSLFSKILMNTNQVNVK